MNDSKQNMDVKDYDPDYDDGIISYGSVTDKQKERYRYLSRQTKIPSDFKLSSSSLDINNDYDNDKSTLELLDESTQNATINIENSSNITKIKNEFCEEEKETVSMKLKQSSMNDSPCTPVFSSPCVTGSIPSKSLVDTEILHRYMRMDSLSSDESFAENQTSLIEGDFNCDLDVQEMEFTKTKSVDNKTYEKLSSLNIIKQNQSNDQDNIPDVSNNICTLQYHSQEENNDLSIGSDSDFENDSILPDKYSVTPGKQRLFDLRFVKKSFPAKISKTSAPFMDRIEETTTPVVENPLNSSMTFINDDSYKSSEAAQDLDVSMVNNKSCNLNQTHCDWELESITNESIVNNSNMKVQISEDKKLEAMEVQIYSNNTSIIDNNFDDLPCTNILSTNDKIVNVNDSLTKTNQSINNSNVSQYNFDTEMSVNDISNATILTHCENEFKNDEKSIVEMEVNSTNTIIINNTFEDSTFTDMLLTNKTIMNVHNSLTEINPSINTSNVFEYNFDTKMSVNVNSDTTIPNNCENEFKNDEKSVVGMEDNSTSTHIMNNVFNEKCTYKISPSNRNKIVDKSFTEVIQSVNSPNVSECNFDTEISVNIISGTTIPTNCKNKFKNDEKSIVEINGNPTFTNKLSINNTIVNVHNSLTEINPSINTSNVSECNFDTEMSINVISDTTIPKNCENEFKNDEKSVVEIEDNSTNTHFMDNVFNDKCTDKFSPNKINKNFDKSFTEVIQSVNSLNVPECNVDTEISVNVISDTTIPTNYENEFKNNEKSIMEMKDNSTNASFINNSFKDPTFTDNLLTKSTIINVNKSLTEVNPSVNTSNVLECNFDTETSESVNLNAIVPIITNGMPQMNQLGINSLKSCNNADLSYLEKLKHNNSTEALVTFNQTLKIPSHTERQYLNFEQTVCEMCSDNISPNVCNSKLNESNNYNNQTQENISMVEQTFFSESFSSLNTDSSFVVSNSPVSNLSVIIENRTLEEDSNDIQNMDKNQDDNMFDKLTIKNEVKSINDFTSNFEVTSSLQKNENNMHENVVNSELYLVENKSTTSNLIIEEKLNETRPNDSYLLLYNELSKSEKNTSIKVDNQLDNNAIDQTQISQYIDELILNQSNCDKNNLSGINNIAAIKNISISEGYQYDIIDKQQNVTSNDIHQLDLLDMTENKNQFIEDYIKTNRICNLEDDKIQLLDSKTSKTKIFDFSIVQQTPISKKAQNTSLVGNFIKRDNLIMFSPVNETHNLKIKSSDEAYFKEDNENSPLNNISSTSDSNTELVDESIKINSSDYSNKSFDKTMIGTNLNQSTNACEINDEKLIDQSNNLNKTIEQVEYFKLSSSTTNLMHNNQCVEKDAIENINFEPKCLSDTIINQSTELKDTCQQLVLNSNEHEKSFIDEQPISNVSELKNNESITTIVESNRIEKSILSLNNKQLNESELISLENVEVVVTSNNKHEKSININVNGHNNITANLEENTILHNTEFLTDIQMNDISLMELSEKSSISESFHSIELEHTQEDNKRKMEPVQEYHNIEKKMKRNVEEPITPISMLYKIKNMFKSSEKPSSSISNNTKENNLRSDKCHQKLDFNILKENKDNFIKPTKVQKSEVLVKSKIPCKVMDRSLAKCDESINSLLNDSIKSKKTIPKFVGIPVLSDLSNSTNKKCLESRIPAKFKK